MIPLIAIAGILAVSAAPAEFYESRYDHLDVESILNNRRMVNYYAACLLSKGPCPPQGVDLKRVLPEALQTNCAKCTEKQRTAAYRSIKRLKKEYPKIWEQLRAVWDPDDVFIRKFETSFESGKPSGVISTNTSPPSPILSNRFGENEEADAASNVISSTPLPPTTSTTTRTTLTTKFTTKPSTKPTNKPVVVTKPPQAPPFATVGANLQATVTFMAALKNIVIQLCQHKLEVINSILSGR
ncbi:chemosensory protein 6 isoform X1 [Tribolium castaneum]|uniref:Chemosensory protein 13 n=1 Tax=Tribolium castaneum TaxID=7070 RepID=D6WUE8_TRICA|nr:PREDICTED: chemosensory protein 6 isoform X1 [Tribolium castaneum]EFA07565.2 chemosensory protein 13 [Tribolium castaneum]|eukprot:XP_008193776.1 PREDICTED: chemosensory protein 6 isoform X1 [Tribolium castaneum]